MAQWQAYEPEPQGGGRSGVRRMTNLAGAVTSLALVVGAGMWAYGILKRDVSGIPVVRAIEGPMRVLPDDPGGTQAPHQGLSVNGVVAEGGAGRPADRLVLAPEPLRLSVEDAATQTLAPSESLQVAALVAPSDEEPAPVDVPVAEVPVIDATPAPSAGPRPRARPARGQQAGTAGGSIDDAIAEALGGAPVREVDPGSIPTGTRLAQLGAFDTAEVARREWDRLAVRFGEYLENKQRVIQEAQSGGRSFYRLRAMGFDDLGDARRFCSALMAENADCIPVVTR